MARESVSGHRGQEGQDGGVDGWSGQLERRAESLQGTASRGWWVGGGGAGDSPWGPGRAAPSGSSPPSPASGRPEQTLPSLGRPDKHTAAVSSAPPRTKGKNC